MEAAAVYAYTPAQNRVIDLYNDYRTALMNAKYYASRLRSWKTFNLIADLVIAITSSTAFAGLAVWKVGLGTNIFSVALGISALVSAIRPVFRISDKIDRYSKLH